MLNKIGYYQFDNLIKNRIPFCFVNLATDLSTWYESIYKLHLENQQMLTTFELAEVDLNSRKIPKDFALLIVCKNGQESEKLAKKLEENGYTNVYLIDGGVQQMMTDKV